MVCNESFKNKKIRRRPRSYSKINEKDEIDGRTELINEKIEFKERTVANGNIDGDDIYFNANGICKDALPEELHENFDKCSNRYETAIANIDELIAKVVSIKRKESMNGNSKYKENISINKKSCCCNDEIPIIDEHRIKNELNKSESDENLIKNRDNQLDKCINFSDSVGCVVMSDRRKRRAKSLGKNGFVKNECRNNSCEKVQKNSEKFQYRSASVGSERYSSSSSEDDNNYSKNSQRGRSRVKRRQRHDKQIQGENFYFKLHNFVSRVKEME